jgi:predicted porin
MNKKLLTIAIGAALAAPMLAQAEVKISGQMHMSADLMDVMSTYSANETSKEWNVSSNSSFFKIEVNEDLGGGMKAIGVFQEYLRMDNTAGGNTTASANTGGWTGNYYWYASTKNTSRLYDGEAYLGLSSGFGTVLLGSMDTPAKKTGRLGDFFGNQIGDSRNLDVNNTRAQNSVSYTSPTFAGVTIVLHHSTNLDNSLGGVDPYFSSQSGGTAPFSASDKKLNSLGVTYKGGPVTVGLAREIVIPIGYLGQGPDDETWTNLAASFDVGPATIKAFYQMHENVASAFPSNMDKSTMGVGAALKFGNSKVKAQYYQVSDEDTLAPDTNSGDAKMIAVGYDYSFSKTFTGYVAYAQTENDTNKRYSMATGGHGDAPFRGANLNGETMNGLSLGAILNF